MKLSWDFRSSHQITIAGVTTVRIPDWDIDKYLVVSMSAIVDTHLVIYTLFLCSGYTYLHDCSPNYPSRTVSLRRIRPCGVNGFNALTTSRLRWLILIIIPAAYGLALSDKY